MPAYDVKLQLKAAGLQSGSTNGNPVDLGSAVPNKADLLQFDMTTTVITGTSIDVVIEESPDQTNWRQVTSFRTLVGATDGLFTGANTTGKRFARFGLVTQRYLRYRSTIAAGTCNFALNALGMDAVARGTSTLSF